MKIYLTATNTLTKYSTLYESLYKIFSLEKAFEVTDVCNDADCIVCAGDITQGIIDCKRLYKTAVVRFLFRSDISQYFYTDVTQVDYTFWVCDLDINILCPYQQTSEKIAVPFDFTLVENSRSDVAYKFDIYVNTGEFLYADSALFKILRTLNRLTQFDKVKRDGYLSENGELIWENDSLEKRMASKLKNKRCLTCRILLLCHGGCTKHSLTAKDDYCVYNYNDEEMNQVVLDAMEHNIQLGKIKRI